MNMNTFELHVHSLMPFLFWLTSSIAFLAFFLSLNFLSAERDLAGYGPCVLVAEATGVTCATGTAAVAVAVATTALAGSATTVELATGVFELTTSLTTKACKYRQWHKLLVRARL